MSNNELTTEVNSVPMCANCKHCPLQQKRHGNMVSVPREHFYCRKAQKEISSPSQGGQGTCYDYERLS